jgi:hypothetical protein
LKSGAGPIPDAGLEPAAPLEERDQHCEPVTKMSGRKMVAITASCFITALRRFETVEAETYFIRRRSSIFSPPLLGV